MQVTRKQCTGTGPIKNQILLAKPKWEITKITNSQNTTEEMANRLDSYFQKGGHSATQTDLKVK